MCGELVESVDVLPTLCAMAEVPPPDWADGFDLTATLQGGAAVRSCAVTENPLTRTIHSKRHKLTLYLPETSDGCEFGELFDLENDPWERYNLFLDPSCQDVVRELRRELYEWLARTTRAITVNGVYLARDGQGWVDWDEAEHARSQDGKVGRQIIAELIARQQLNYL